VTAPAETSRSVAIRIDTAELVSQTATLRRPRAVLHAIIGCDLRSTQHCLRALLACYPYLLVATYCRRLLHAAAACCTKTRPEVARGWSPSWDESEQSDFGWFGRSLEHEAASFHTWHKPHGLASKGASWSDAHQLPLLKFHSTFSVLNMSSCAPFET